MTPERAQFHLLMLEAGESRLFQMELNAALEAEEPLSDLTLALSLCGSDEESMHVLRAYLLDHPVDMTLVGHMLRQELRARLEQGAMSPETCLKMMHTLACATQDGHALTLFADVVAVEEYRDLAADGILCEEAYVLSLEALLKAEPLPDVWKLNRQIVQAKKSERPYSGEGHPAILTIPEEMIRPKEK